jgi:4-diphosphocytidyl-2-C-methyl-D-erythritol kinase
MPQAPAKLNLLLSVGDALPEGHADTPAGKAGYHAISSWFASISLADELTVERRKAGSCDDDASTWAARSWASDAPAPTPLDWPLEKDLCVRAARALQAHVGSPLAVRLALTKRIPVGAGLGGGSSDAACTLLALREACSLEVSDDALMDIALQLGSDVPYFVRMGTLANDANNADDPPQASGALVDGLGDAIEPLAVPESQLVLVLSRVSCETRAVYRAYDELRALRRAGLAGEGKNPRPYDAPRTETVHRRAGEMAQAGALNERQLLNDLEAAALRVQPTLGPLKTELGKATRRLVHITGSGSAMFIVPEAGKAPWTLERAAKVCAGEAGAAVGAHATLVRTV